MSKIILLSGGFDPLHVGHIAMIHHAARYDARVYIALNSDAWLIAKKGYRFMPWKERAMIVESIRGVDAVIGFDDSDGTAITAIRSLRPTYFANGGDRTQENVPEQDICKELGVEMVWGIGGSTKPQSSSWLVNEAIEQMRQLND